MFITAIIAAGLVTVTAGMHVAGFAIMLKKIFRPSAPAPTQGLPIATQIMCMAWFLTLLHVMEVGVWAWFYRLSRCFSDAESALYFSASTYTSVGYGDLLLPIRWRILGPIESLTGILMCGLSASAFFALISRIAKARSMAKQE